MIAEAVLFALLQSLGRALAMAVAKNPIDEELRQIMREIYIHAHNAQWHADEHLMVALDEIMVIAQAGIRGKIEE